MPTVKDMMLARMNQPNILIDVEDNFKNIIDDCEWEINPVMACVNPGKHEPLMDFDTVTELEAHIKHCFGFKENLRLMEKKEKDSETSIKKLEIY